MARLSDLTYLTRAVFTSWTFLWFLQHVWNIDRFEALKWERVKKHDLKSVITILLVIMCPLQAFFDISSSILKYQEGFWVNPLNGDIMTKPDIYWSETNKKLVVPTNYILCANFSLMTCLLFLLQSFWNYLAKNLAKTSFMGSFEFKSYIIYAVFSVFIFPFLQFFFRHDLLLTEVIPQLVYSVFMFLIALFGLRSHKRFTNLLCLTRKSSASQVTIIAKLEYFRDMNRYLTWSLFLGSLSIMSLSIDGLTTVKYLNTHKFFADFIMCNMSFALWVVFVTLMLIFYPSSNTISDSVALTKGASFSGNAKKSLKNDILEPPTPQWIRSQNADESQWSSQISSQQSISQIDSNSFSVSIYEELPPPIPYHERKSNSLEIPHTPPSPYRPLASIPPNTLPPPLPPPPPAATAVSSSSSSSSSPKIQQKLTIQPPILSYSTQLTQSPTSPVKQSKLEKLKYPSTPLLSRNNSFDNNFINDDNNNTSSSTNNFVPNNSPLIQSASVPIVSPSPRKNYTGYSLDSPVDYSVKPSPPKKSSRRPSITSSDITPAIRVTTSTTSLRSTNSITLPSSDEDDKELSTINKITNLDTRKVAPFMYQNEPVRQERSISQISRSPSPNIATTKTEESPKSVSQRSIPIEIPSQQQNPKLSSVKSSQAVIQQQSGVPLPNRVKSSSTDNSDNDNNNATPPLVLTPKASPTSKSSSTLNTSLKSKTQTATKSYQSSPLGRVGSGTNEITSSSSSSPTVKKSSPAQVNNLKNSTAKSRNGSGAGGAASVVRNSVASTRSRSNSTASVGSGKVSSTSTANNEKKNTKSSVKNSVKNSMKNSMNSVRNSVVGGRTRSNSTASVGVRNSVVGRVRSESISSGADTRNSIISPSRKTTTGRDRSISSASNSSISSTSSFSSSSSSSISGSIKNGIKSGVGNARRNSRIS